MISEICSRVVLERINHMRKIAFLFPGQGSQYQGMGKNLLEAHPEIKKIFNEGDEALGFSMTRLILEGPEEELKKTENTQPALLITSMAYFHVLKKLDVTPSIVAGHSLGEYSALVANGVLDFSTACKLVRKRGQYMQEAVAEGKGAMAAFLGLSEGVAKELIHDVQKRHQGILGIAGCNSPGQIVLSGDRLLVEKACERAPSFGAKRATLLKVSAPFHCSLMKPAEEKLQLDLKECTFGHMKHPYVANADAKTYENSQTVFTLLLEQVCKPVLWEQSMINMWNEGTRTFLEVGPGRVLSGLCKRSLSSFTKSSSEEVLIESLDEASGLKPLAIFT